jgi:hypothetical protein
VKINIPIELNPEQLDSIATLIDNKVTKRMATRKDINTLVGQFIGGLTTQADFTAGKVTQDTEALKASPKSDLLRIRPGEEKLLAGKPESYVYGWNKARSDGK